MARNLQALSVSQAQGGAAMHYRERRRRMHGNSARVDENVYHRTR